MKTYTAKELNKILKEHLKWLINSTNRSLIILEKKNAERSEASEAADKDEVGF